MKEHVLHLRRHMAARAAQYVGKEIKVPGTEETAIVGNGNYLDGEAHIQRGEDQKAHEIGETLYVPTRKDIKLVVASSPLVRAQETERFMFEGMGAAYAKRVLGVDVEGSLSSEDKMKLLKDGLHKKVAWRQFKGLVETDYLDSRGNPDDGNELVAEAYCKAVNPKESGFPGYRWMVERGFQDDPRSENPFALAYRALREVIPALLNNDVVLSTSHQPNLEIITAVLIKDKGEDGNELFENAGGPYGMGGGFELRVCEIDGVVKEASLMRTGNDPTKLEKELNVDLEMLKNVS